MPRLPEGTKVRITSLSNREGTVLTDHGTSRFLSGWHAVDVQIQHERLGLVAVTADRRDLALLS